MEYLIVLFVIMVIALILTVGHLIYAAFLAAPVITVLVGCLIVFIIIAGAVVEKEEKTKSGKKG